MKKGDRVHLKDREEVTGTIIDTRVTPIWNMTFDEYLVKYDQTLVPPQDWHEECHLVILIEDTPVKKENKCECGVNHVMPINGKHSSWCPLYRKY